MPKPNNHIKWYILFDQWGIVKGAAKTPLQYSLDNPGYQELERLIRFYKRHDNSIYKTSEDLAGVLSGLKDYQVYVWITRDNKNTVVHGHTVIKDNKIIDIGYCKNINDAKIVNRCIKLINKEN